MGSKGDDRDRKRAPSTARQRLEVSSYPTAAVRPVCLFTTAAFLLYLLVLMAALAYLYGRSVNSCRPPVSPLTTPTNLHPKTRKHQLPYSSAGGGGSGESWGPGALAGDRLTQKRLF